MKDIHVMIVDDEKEFGSTLAERLELRGFRAGAVFSADEALEVINSSTPPDVVLLDLKMPNMDGLEVLEKIKKRDTSIEVVMLTGHGSANSSVLGMKQGAYAYVMKPVDIDDLVGLIKEASRKKETSTGREERTREGRE